ncbi:MAG: tRNA threonylcarbamoyladenosine dehydratase [Selenomonadales bacterium]|nr:tRNA threonylcarbamoyladenosine dehydratase [Selenomonadales bacterium]
MAEETWNSRTVRMLGEEGAARLERSTVMVLGIGGVGSYAAEGLARAGVGRLILVDPETISLSNVNRQIHSLRSTVGQYKTDAMKARIADISPEIEVVTMHTFYSPETVEELMAEAKGADYIIDAIDTVSAKIDLAVRAHEMGIPIISAMGAGNKLDPTRFEVADITKTSVCPLARVMRRELKKRGISHLKVVYSKEEPLDANSERDSETGKASPGSISFVPSVVGMILAGQVVRDISGR